MLVEQGADGTLTSTTLTGNGSDTLAGLEHASLAGDGGPDEIDASGFGGAVEIAGYGGDDILTGGPRGDTFQGGVGNDTFYGGPGSDLVVEGVDGASVLTDSSLTGQGTDILDSIESARISGLTGNDTIDASGFAGFAELRGGAGNDSLTAPRGGSRLEGEDGDDALTGGPGADAFEAGAGNDRTFSRDEVTEQVDCGDGADSAVADVLDGLAGCEQIDRGDGPGEPGQPGGPGADALAPTLSKLTLSHRSFRAAARGAALSSAAVGTGVRFTLSENANVTFRIERARPGTTRYVRLRGTVTYRGVAGVNKVALRGRLRRRALTPGRYRLVARATDAAGNRSAPRRAGFRIVVN